MHAASTPFLVVHRPRGRPWHAAAWLTAWLATFALLFAGLPARADEVAVPPFSSRVVDTTNTLSEADAQALRTRIAEIEDATRIQLAVLIVSSTREEDIAPFAMRVFEAWQPGSAERNDGLLVVVALADRRMRIEVGQGLEGTVPDIAAARIVDHVMAPRFRERDYAGGLRGAIDALDRRVRGEAPADDAERPLQLTVEGGALIAVLVWGLLVGGWHAWRKPRWRVTVAAAAAGPVLAGVTLGHPGVAIAGLMLVPGFVALGWVLTASRRARWVAVGTVAVVAALVAWGTAVGEQAFMEGFFYAAVGGFALALAGTTLYMMRKAWLGSRKVFWIRLLVALLFSGVGLWQLFDGDGGIAPAGVLEGVVVLVSFLIAFIAGAGSGGWSADSSSSSSGSWSSSSSSSSSSSGGGGSSSGGGASGSW